MGSAKSFSVSVKQWAKDWALISWRAVSYVFASEWALVSAQKSSQFLCLTTLPPCPERRLSRNRSRRLKDFERLSWSRETKSVAQLL